MGILIRVIIALLMIGYGILVLVLSLLSGQFMIDTGLAKINFFFFTHLFATFPIGLALIGGGYMTRKSFIYTFIALGSVMIMMAASNEIKIFCGSLLPCK